VLRGVRTLLHDEGYTIKGVQRLHREEGVRRLLTAGGATPALARKKAAPPPSQPVLFPTEAAPPLAPAAAENTPHLRLAPAELTDLNRRKLRAALEDLTAIKADIDALLAQNSG